MVKPVPDVRMMKKVHLVQTTENIDLVKIEAANAHELAARGQAFEQMLKERAAADDRRAGWFRRFAGVLVAVAAVGLCWSGPVIVRNPELDKWRQLSICA